MIKIWELKLTESCQNLPNMLESNQLTNWSKNVKKGSIIQN